MSYIPVAPPAIKDEELQAFVRWLIEELNRLSELLLAYEQGRALPVRTTAPAKHATGQLVYADGTKWNPGAGEGHYEMRSDGNWHKL